MTIPSKQMDHIIQTTKTVSPFSLNQRMEDEKEVAFARNICDYDQIVGWAESIVRDIIIVSPPSFSTIKSLLGSDLSRKHKQELLAALADYDIQWEDEELAILLKKLALSGDKNLAFSATHTLAVGNKKMAAEFLKELQALPESIIKNLSLQALHHANIR